MNLLWRFLWTILFSRFSSTVDVFDKCTTTFRVLPTDVDLLFHMNNGRYFSLMDLARINYIIRCKMYRSLVKNNLYPVVASEMIRFKKSIHLFQRFDVTTQLIAWDDKFFYMAQHFLHQNEICAMSIIKACFLEKRGGRVSTHTTLELIGQGHHKPLPMPDWVQEWISADQKYYDETSKRTSS